MTSLTDQIAEDAQTAEKLQSFSSLIDTRYLSAYGYTTDLVLATNPYGRFSSIG